jgi:hypothetical protein
MLTWTDADGYNCVAAPCRVFTIACMAKRKKPGDEMPPEAPPKPAKRVRPGKANLNVWIAASVIDALDRYVEGTEPKPTATSAVEHALKRFLAEVGYWPPPKPGPAGGEE